MRVHSIYHGCFRGLNIIDQWIQNRNHVASESHPNRGESLPPIDDIDFLIILGGPQSARKLDQYPYLHTEIEFIRQAIDHNKIILGICLGAQLLAEALGAQTQKSPQAEIGMHPIELTEAGLLDPIFSTFPLTFDVMHWHFDMVGWVPGMTLLAKSQGCPHQAFKYGHRIYGLQFHLEMEPLWVQAILEHSVNPYQPGRFVQSPQQLLNHDYTTGHAKIHAILDHLAQPLTAF